MSEQPAKERPGNNVYTVLLILAAIWLAASTFFLVVRSQQLFGTWNPFSGT